MALQSLDILQRSASPTPAPSPIAIAVGIVISRRGGQFGDAGGSAKDNTRTFTLSTRSCSRASRARTRKDS